MAAIGTIVSVAASVVSAVSAVTTGVLAKKQAESQARIIRDQASARARAQRQRTRRILATQEAITGGSGTLINEGSPLDVALESVKQGELRAQNEIWRGQVFGQALRRRGSMALATGILAGVSSGLKGASQSGAFNQQNAQVDHQQANARAQRTLFLDQ